jgi:hypothetical protein
MQHQAYRHIETELFVQRSRLAEMLALTRWLLELAAGESSPGRAAWLELINAEDLSSAVMQLKGRYRHHYPICIRRVESDNGFITMSGSDSDESWYAVSFICYAAPDKRDGFLQFSRVMTKLSSQHLDARPHWGKWFELPPQHVNRLYPHYQKFVEIREQVDPTGAFRPPWLGPSLVPVPAPPPMSE